MVLADSSSSGKMRCSGGEAWDTHPSHDKDAAWQLETRLNWSGAKLHHQCHRHLGLSQAMEPFICIFSRFPSGEGVGPLFQAGLYGPDVLSKHLFIMFTFQPAKSMSNQFYLYSVSSQHKLSHDEQSRTSRPYSLIYRDPTFPHEPAIGNSDENFFFNCLLNIFFNRQKTQSQLKEHLDF